jgi:hypothetical protein
MYLDGKCLWESIKQAKTGGEERKGKGKQKAHTGYPPCVMLGLDIFTLVISFMFESQSLHYLNFERCLYWLTRTYSTKGLVFKRYLVSCCYQLPLTYFPEKPCGHTFTIGRRKQKEKTVLLFSLRQMRFAVIGIMHHLSYFRKVKPTVFWMDHFQTIRIATAYSPAAHSMYAKNEVSSSKAQTWLRIAGDSQAPGHNAITYEGLYRFYPEGNLCTCISIFLCVIRQRCLQLKHCKLNKSRLNE